MKNGPHNDASHIPVYATIRILLAVLVEGFISIYVLEFNELQNTQMQKTVTKAADIHFTIHFTNHSTWPMPLLNVSLHWGSRLIHLLRRNRESGICSEQKIKSHNISYPCFFTLCVISWLRYSTGRWVVHPVRYRQHLICSFILFMDRR